MNTRTVNTELTRNRSNVSRTLEFEYQAALRADFDRLVWLAGAALADRDVADPGAIREALLKAYRSLIRFHTT